MDARRKPGIMHVYTRRKKTVDVQYVEQQVEQPQLVEQQHSSTGDVEIV